MDNSDIAAVVNLALRSRTADRTVGVNISRGIRPQSEKDAYPHVLPALNLDRVSRPRQINGIVRGAALAAFHTRVPNGEMRFGHALAQFAKRGPSSRSTVESIGKKLQLLPELQLENAVQVIDGLLSRISGSGVEVNFINLTERLAYWQTTHPLTDIEWRQSIVFDFYAPSSTKPRAAATE